LRQEQKWIGGGVLMILQKTRTQEKKVFKKVKKQVAMSHVDEFCAQQGNVLRKPLKFEGQMVRNLYPNENVCRQLHERWMRSGGRQMMFAEFKKRLRFKSTDDMVSVWLSWDSTPAIAAGLGGLGAAGLTTAAVLGYKAWQNSKTPSHKPRTFVYETWDDVPPKLKAPAFEYVTDLDLQYIPAHIVMLYDLYRFNPAEPAKDSGQDDGESGCAVDRAIQSIFAKIKAGDVVLEDQLKGLVASIESGCDTSGLLDEDLTSIEAIKLLEHADVGVTPFDIFKSEIKSETFVKQKGEEQFILRCDSQNFSKEEFDSINSQVFGFDLKERLTYNNGVVELHKDRVDQCILHVPQNSKVATEDDEAEFKEIEYQLVDNDIELKSFVLVDPDLSGHQLFGKRIENRRKPGARSMISYRSLADVRYNPKSGSHLVMYINSNNVNKVAFNCYQVKIGGADFALTFVAFHDMHNSLHVAILVDGTWVFYGGQDPKDTKRYLRKIVPQNNLDSIGEDPYLLIFTKIINS
jgi:hypothetical protein